MKRDKVGATEIEWLLMRARQREDTQLEATCEAALLGDEPSQIEATRRYDVECQEMSEVGCYGF